MVFIEISLLKNISNIKTQKTVRFLIKKCLLYLFLGLVFGGCGNSEESKIEPIISDNISYNARLLTPKKAMIMPKAPDVLIIKPDTLKAVIKNDTVKKNIGDAIFEFYDITSPDMACSFPSHSIVMIPVSYVGKDVGVANSFCEYWLYTKDGKLVCYCKNTVSGLHPVYGNAVNTNNHLPEYTKKIAFGEYRLVYKNISKVPVKQDLIFGLIINQGKDQIDTKVDSGETREFWIKIYPSESNFKLNNNNKEKI